MNIKNKYLKYKKKYIELKNQIAGAKQDNVDILVDVKTKDFEFEKSEPLIDVMSITKAAIGLMYHVHKNEFSRANVIQNKGKTMFSIGQALNMMTGYDNDEWDYNDYRKQVEKKEDIKISLEDYSKNKLSVAAKILTWKYNNLVYQLLASNMRDVADRFGKFMEDPAGPLIDEKDYKDTTVWFKHGKHWKWEHTKEGEPLGPHGLWTTQSFAKQLGKKARDHINMTRGERINIQQGWSNYFTPTKISQYWNGWWLSDNSAYAIGHVCQIIAITPTDVKTQIYEEDWDNALDREENHNDHRWFFIDKIEEKI
jgi:hypothetical protein